jgi:FdhE protein
MSQINVLDTAYEQLHEQIQTLHEKWYEQIGYECVVQTEGMSLDAPLAPQVVWNLKEEHYQSFLQDLLRMLAGTNNSIKDSLEKVQSLLTDELLIRWFEEAIAVNNYYFQQFAEEKNVEPWLPFFLAEHAVRPFLQKASHELGDILIRMDAHIGCPCCGEPARLAIISKKGKKQLTCPRCSHSWQEKKICCAHCGTDEHEKVEILKIEGDERAEIHVCLECKGYTKVIDTRKLIGKAAPALLDLRSIHLDYIAQEHGFGTLEGTDRH